MPDTSIIKVDAAHSPNGRAISMRLWENEPEDAEHSQRIVESCTDSARVRGRKGHGADGRLR